MMHVLPRFSIAAIGALLAAGCAIAPPDLAPERQLRQRLGLDREMEVRIEPEAREITRTATTLTIAEAAETALRHDARLQGALARYRVALADARQERLLPNPVLSLTVRYPTAGGKPSVEAGLAADLISILQRPGKIGAADHRLRAAAAEVLVVALDTLQETQETYVRMQTLQLEMPLLLSGQQLLQRLLTVSQARLDTGEATSLDVSTLQSQRVELDLELARKREQLRQEQLAMAKLLGQPQGHAQWQLSEIPATLDAAVVDEQALIDAALDHRPELLARQWELAALGGDLKAARLAAIEGGEAGVDAERDDGWSVGPSVSVPLPLFDWGQARREALRAKRSEAAHALTETTRQVVREIRQSLAAMEASESIAQVVNRELLPLAEKRLGQAELEYRTGLTDVTALVLAEQELQSAQRQLVQAQGDAALAEARLRRACGGILPPAPSTQPSSQRN